MIFVTMNWGSNYSHINDGNLSDPSGEVMGNNVTETWSNVTESSILSVQHPSKTNTVSFNGPPERSAMPLIIASPVAAISILIFVCIAYYCHAAQLDKRAKLLATHMAAEGAGLEIRIQDSATNTSVLSTCDADKLLCTQKRRNTLLPVPTSPNGSVSRSPRSSVNWSAMADQEMLNFSSPRRHSTFII